MKYKQARRLFALLLVFALVIGLLPSVLADNEPDISAAESAEETLVDSRQEDEPAIAPPTQSILESDEAVESSETETDDKAEQTQSLKYMKVYFLSHFLLFFQLYLQSCFLYPSKSFPHSGECS